MQSNNNYYFTFVKLIHGEKSYDISQMVKAINIFESIDSMFLIGDVSIEDAGNHLESWKINDEDWTFSFGFYSDLLGHVASVSISLYGITKYKKSSDTVTTYTFEICSPEAMRNLDIRISKGYSGTKKSILMDILSQLKSRKFLLTDENKETTRFLCPKMKPFDAINLMLLYNQTTPDYLFWESLVGFNCHSIRNILNSKPTRTLYEKNINLTTDKEKLSSPDDDSDPNIIKSYQIETLFDYLTEMNNGSRGATVFEYDIITGKNNVYKIDDKHANNAHYIFYENTFNYSLYLQRHKILTQLDNNKWNVECNGDYTRHCGDLVYVKLLKGNNDNPGFLSSYCGNFIITDIRHTWTTTSYDQSISLSR